MGEVVQFKQKPKPDVDGPYLMVQVDGRPELLRVSDIEGMASGECSIAEFSEVEGVARMMAIALMDSINGEI